MNDGNPEIEQKHPVVRSLGELDEIPGQQTPGIRRRQAFAGEDRWVGHVETEPGVWSGWHHHGDTDTYLYVIAGGLEFEFGSAHELVTVSEGSFAHVPAGVVHRERTIPGRPGEIMLVRIGHGPAVVNVDSPEASS